VIGFLGYVPKILKLAASVYIQLLSIFDVQNYILAHDNQGTNGSLVSPSSISYLVLYLFPYLSNWFHLQRNENTFFLIVIISTSKPSFRNVHTRRFARSTSTSTLRPPTEPLRVYCYTNQVHKADWIEFDGRSSNHLHVMVTGCQS
jgi:hypothetical protein